MAISRGEATVNRINKISDKYAQHKPELDRLREKRREDRKKRKK